MKNAGVGLFVALHLLACSGGTATKAEPSPAPVPQGPPPPTSCRQTDRSGTYLLTWTKSTGTCGEIPAQLVPLAPQVLGDGGTFAGGLGSACTIHSDVWSDGNCRNDRSFTCVVMASGATTTIDYVTITRQETENGSTIDGTVSLRATDSAGGCTGIYTVVYLRQ